MREIFAFKNCASRVMEKKQSLRDVQSSEGSTAQCSPVSAHDIHTYIYFLLRQVGLRQPKGWWGPARNLNK